MAPRRKSKFNKKLLAIPAVVIGAIVLVFMFPVLQTIDQVNPIYNAEDFDVPELSIQEIEENEEIQEMVSEVVQDHESFCEFSQSELDFLNECEELIADENFVTSVPSNIDPETFQICGLTDEQVLDCDAEITQILNDLNAQLNEVDMPMNDTEFSDDDPGQQLCDLTDCEDNPVLDPILPEASFVTLEAKVTKITSQGQRIESVSTFDLPQQAFLVEEETNLDFRNGFLEIELTALTDPEITLSGSGTLDVRIGGSSVLTNVFDLSVSPVNNTDGRVQLLVNNQDKISISFDNFFNSFPNEIVTPIEFFVDDLILSDLTNEFSNTNLKVFTMNILRDDTQIIIQDEEGNNIRTFPMDSRIVIHSVASQSEPYQTCMTRERIWTSNFVCNGCGCTQHQLTTNRQGDPCLAGGSNPTTIPVPAPTVTSITVVDSQGNIIPESISGGTGNSLVGFNMIPRNQSYTLFASGNSGVVDFGVNQETKSFTCTQEGTPNLVGNSYQTGQFSPCSTVIERRYQELNTNDPLSLGAIQCNIP